MLRLPKLRPAAASGSSFTEPQEPPEAALMARQVHFMVLSLQHHVIGLRRGALQAVCKATQLLHNSACSMQLFLPVR